MTKQVATAGVKGSPAGSQQWVHGFTEPIAGVAAAQAAIAAPR